MANDLLDQTLRDFDSFRLAHKAAWDSLLKTGIEVDPNDGRYHSLFSFNLNPETHTFRVYAVFTNGPAAKGGLLVGDVIQSINGRDVAGMSSDELAPLLNTDKLSLVVNRPGGQMTLSIEPKKYSDLLSSLSR